MFKLCVYHQGTLRYITFGNLKKARELRDQGFFVDIRVVPALSCEQ